MQIIYEIDEEDWAKEYGYIDGNHGDGGLPGVSCDACGAQWAAYGFSYPGVDITVIADYKTIFQPRNVTVSEYEKIRNLILELGLLPEGSYLPPGTTFGTILGAVVGKLEAFAWCEGAMMVKRAVYDNMAAVGLQLPVGYPVRLKFREGEPAIQMLELDVPRLAKFSGSNDDVLPPIPCTVCDRISSKSSTSGTVLSSSIPHDMDIVRPRYFGRFFATERFRTYCLRHDLRNIIFDEQRTAED